MKEKIKIFIARMVVKKKVKIIFVIIGVVFLLYLSCYHYTDSYEFGMTQNFFTGEVKPDGHAGRHITYPWVLATKIDTRPHRVSIASATRNLNCRLVQFDPSKYQELIRIEGFHYYWWYNRFSFNSGQETYRGVDNLLLGHSYGNNRGSFVKIIQEIGDESN
jgi:hypothetical protein